MSLVSFKLFLILNKAFTSGESFFCNFLLNNLSDSISFIITLRLGSDLCNFTQSSVHEGLLSVSSFSEIILESHEIDSIKLDFDFEPVNIALTIWVSMLFKSMSMSSLARIFGHEILLRASASTLLCPHLYLMVKL